MPSLIAACQSCGFSPNILHEVMPAVSRIAFVDCSHGVALVPAALDKLVPPNVELRVVDDDITHRDYRDGMEHGQPSSPVCRHRKDVR